MPFTSKQRRFFHAAADRHEKGMPGLADEADQLAGQGKERPPVPMSRGGFASKAPMVPFEHEKKVGAPPSFQDHRGMVPGMAMGGMAGGEGISGGGAGRYADGGPVNDDYRGDEGEAAYRGSEEDRAEEFADGGMVECPHCGGPVSVHGDVGSEEGSEKYASHGEAGQYEPEESFGRALMRKYGDTGGV